MKKSLLLLGLVAAIAAQAETVVIEAESFDDWGGWVNNTQFMDQMGSPYLLAHGLGKPVADARTKFVVAGGRYNVWVRTKNWTSFWHPDIGAGTFNLIINGKKLPNLLGCQGKGEWLWVKADDVTLKGGKNTLALHDCDGFDGRVDAICFTTNPQPTSILNGPRPPSVIAQPIPLPKFDLCVVGGGIAGICTAVSAARLGLSVALVHDRPILGGNNSSEVRVHLSSYQNLPPYPRLGDVLLEFGPRNGGNARDAANYEDERKLAIIKAERNIRLFLNEHVNEVKTNEMGRILSVRSINTKTGVATWFEAVNFVDCTGDGNLGFAAGADFRMGREAKGETNEPGAPEKADMITMGSSVQWNAGKAEGDAAFPVRPWMLKTFKEENCSPHLRGDWFWEAGLGRDQIAEGEYIRDYGLLVAYSNWAFVKNGYSKSAEFADKELKWVAYNAGRRESRRLMGDFILDQNHLRNRDVQPDGTCVATWTIDLHLPKTAEESKFEGEPFQANSLNEKIWPYPIPYRCFYSRNVPNLFMAGRDISVTHIALGTTRLMRTHGMMGEVVGMAASICKKHGCNPRDVYTTHLDELKELMTKGVGDGKKHPRQDYNVQQSLDPDIKKHHEESVKGRVE
ncbi:MAG: FAD-dependent oxidoreductase [Kiritimatiellae bacterium]|nr:FAD-dependent oxidoreductase [Kiritimatiellia bacterium]